MPPPSSSRRPSRDRGPTSTALSATLYHAITGAAPPSAFDRMLGRRLRAARQAVAAGFGAGAAGRHRRRLAAARHRQAAVDRRLAAESWPGPARPIRRRRWRTAQGVGRSAAAILMRPPATATAVTAPAKRQRRRLWIGLCRGPPACGGRGYCFDYQARVTPDPAVVGAARKQREAVEAGAAKRKVRPTRNSLEAARSRAAARQRPSRRPRSASRSRRRPGAGPKAEMAAGKRVEDEARRESRSRDSGPAGERARRPGRKPRRRRPGPRRQPSQRCPLRRQRGPRDGRRCAQCHARQASGRDGRLVEGHLPLHALQAQRRLYHPRADPQRLRRLRHLGFGRAPGPGTTGKPVADAEVPAARRVIVSAASARAADQVGVLSTGTMVASYDGRDGHGQRTGAEQRRPHGATSR
mgnify:CR=1 FL=1